MGGVVSLCSLLLSQVRARSLLGLMDQVLEKAGAWSSVRVRLDACAGFHAEDAVLAVRITGNNNAPLPGIRCRTTCGSAHDGAFASIHIGDSLRRIVVDNGRAATVFFQSLACSGMLAIEAAMLAKKFVVRAVCLIPRARGQGMWHRKGARHLEWCLT